MDAFFGRKDPTRIGLSYTYRIRECGYEPPDRLTPTWEQVRYRMCCRIPPFKSA